jgi:hypothetical protein
VKDLLRATIREAMLEVLAERDLQQQAEKTVQFSEVGSDMATSICYRLGIEAIDGQLDAPFPDDASYLHCGTFPMHHYADERSATPPFLDFIKKGLSTNGVTFGRGGFSLVDVHGMPLYQLPVGDILFEGGLDGAIVPFAVSRLAPTKQVRAVIQVLHPDKHKSLYKENKSNEEDEIDGTVMGQAIIEVLAAHVFAEYPSLMLLVSSFDTNIILLLEGDKLTIWEELSFDQAMFKLAGYLITCDTDRKYSFLQKRSELPKQQVESVERIRKKLKPTNMMLEQLESVVWAEDDPEARVACAYEIIQAHSANRHNSRGQG